MILSRSSNKLKKKTKEKKISITIDLNRLSHKTRPLLKNTLHCSRSPRPVAHQIARKNKKNKKRRGLTERVFLDRPNRLIHHRIATTIQPRYHKNRQKRTRPGNQTLPVATVAPKKTSLPYPDSPLPATDDKFANWWARALHPPRPRQNARTPWSNSRVAF